MKFRSLTTENTEIHGEEKKEMKMDLISVILCDLCGEKN